MEVQLAKLILDPSVSLMKSAPLILVIDGLDECDDEQAQRKILSLIGNTAQQHPTTFRFIIASRPEFHIRKCLKEDCFSSTLDSTNVEQSFKDTRTYLRQEFDRIHREHSETMGNISKPWPSRAILESLVDKSSGYFIYASTVIKFVDDEWSRPTERLAIVQNLTADSDSEHPFATLDQLYTQILLGVPARFHTKLCDIFTVTEHLDLCIELTEQLLDLEPGDAMLILRRLHSLLQIDPDSHKILLYHKSFLDFLHDPNRSSIFHIGPSQCIRLACLTFREFSGTSKPYRDIVEDVAWSVASSFNIPGFIF
jgi:hypothetical protein